MTQIPASINTDRLGLELITEDDSAFFYDLVNSDGWLAYIGDRNIRSAGDAAVYIRKLRGNENLYYWVVRAKESGVSVGIVSFMKRPSLDSFDLGFAFLPAFGGKGYAHESASAVLSVAAQYPALHPVLAITVPANEKSIKLLEKLGFRFEKEMDGGKLLVYAKHNF